MAHFSHRPNSHFTTVYCFLPTHLKVENGLFVPLLHQVCNVLEGRGKYRLYGTEHGSAILPRAHVRDNLFGFAGTVIVPALLGKKLGDDARVLHVRYFGAELLNQRWEMVGAKISNIGVGYAEIDTF